MKGAVAAGHPLTAAAGARILEEGGNAADACIAAVLVSWVVESTLTGPGGGGHMLVHRARDRRDLALDFFVTVPGKGFRGERAPMEGVDVPFGVGATTQRFLVGEAACAVPGAIAGISEAHRRFASLPLGLLAEPAVELARGGVELTGPQALLHEVLDAVFRRTEEGRRIYGRQRRLERGERLVAHELAGTIEQLAAEGSRPFYEGEIGRRIASVVEEGGGSVTSADLAAYRVIRRRPVRVPYRNDEVVSNPPPSSGGTLIAFALRLFDRLGAGGPPGSAAALTMLARVAAAATSVRDGRFATGLYRGGLARQLLSDPALERAIEDLPLVSAAREPAGLPSTTHVSVVDDRGNAVSCSASLGCGSGVFVPGTGIQLNNMLGETDLAPPSVRLAPGRRLSSMMAPTLVLANGRPRLVLGSAGSERLRGAIVQVILNVIDHGLELADAVGRPRIHPDGATLHVEPGLAELELAALEEAGFTLERWPDRSLFFGGVSAVAFPPGGEISAAGDPRRGGSGVVAS